jgi:hypothetical protein
MFRTIALAAALAVAPLAQAEAPPENGPLATQAVVDTVNDHFTGVGIGMDHGLWGTRYGSSLKLDLPFGHGKIGKVFGVRLRSVVVHNDDDGQFSPIGMAGAELFGRTPVFLGLVRLYGGGGFYYGKPLAIEGAEPALIGGGHYGMEFAASPRLAFTLEVGGQGPIHPDEVDAGASVMAGTTVYLGRVR